MFPPKTPMTLSALTFTTDDVDGEARRIVLLKFELAPFTAPLAEGLLVRSVLFQGGDPKEAIDSVVVRLPSQPLQRMTLAAAPDLDAARIFPNVDVMPKLRAKVKADREPRVMSAVFQVSLQYPDAPALLALACAIGQTLYVTFDAEQGDLLTSAADVDAEPPKRRRGPMVGQPLRPGIHAEH